MNYLYQQPTYFTNLTDKPIEEINRYILNELRLAKTETCLGTYHGEVTDDYIGHHSYYTFRRHTNFWMAEGETEKSVAWKIFNDPVCRHQTKINGSAFINPAQTDKITHYHIMTQEAFNSFIEIINK